MSIDVMKTVVNDLNNDLSTIFEFRPIADGDEKSILDMRADGSNSFIGALNIPVADNKLVVVRKGDSSWNAPVVDVNNFLSIRDCIDNDMKQKINAKGEIKIIGWLDMSYEHKGNHTFLGKTVVTAFKVESMGDFTPSHSYDERSLRTVENVNQEFKDSPVDYGDENVFMHIFDIAVNS